ncbi:MAG TPA: DUF2510 domain-containing protein [Acidimicrobiales bacterium]|nr:DUF2510 domain-containing protein [Acidimicrobiales bacterium]
MTENVPNNQAGAIRVTTGYLALAFILQLVRTRVVVDGRLYELPWGTTVFPVYPGRHRVRVSFKYLFMTDAGANQADVDVTPGQTVEVNYRAPWLVFLKGRMTVGLGYYPGAQSTPLPAPPPPSQPAPQVAAGAPPGWHADPGGRHELRYWDGTAWTEHVSDRGTTGVDPPGER